MIDITFKHRLMQIAQHFCGSDRGWQAKFAKSIGASTGNVANWMNESTNTVPGAESIARICEHYTFNVEWLLTGKGDMLTRAVGDVPPLSDYDRGRNDQKLVDLQDEVTYYRGQIKEALERCAAWVHTKNDSKKP